jgi:hypothetical protein
MCPFCVAAAAVIAVKAATAGGVGAMVVSKIVKSKKAREFPVEPETKEKGQ